MKNNLAAVRYELNLSLRELAKKSGVSWTYIAKIESGERTPTVPVAYAICRAVGKTIYEVFPDHVGN
ncbi:MAG: helix-turn-helix transcriptional regulator [Agathobacter sp.]